MDGKAIARIIDSELASRGISKAEFYEKSGVSSATLSQWRTGKYDPTPDKLAKVEMCLGISFSDYEKSEETPNYSASPKSPVKSTKPLKLLGFGVITSGYNCSYLTAKVLSKCCQKW